MSRRYEGEDHYDYQDRVTADARQEEVDDAAEAKVLAMAKRAASGISPEVLSLQDAFTEGQRAGGMSHGASMNPYQHGSAEYAEWDRGRLSIIAARISGPLRSAA